MEISYESLRQDFIENFSGY